MTCSHIYTPFHVNNRDKINTYMYDFLNNFCTPSALATCKCATCTCTHTHLFYLNPSKSNVFTLLDANDPSGLMRR